MTKKAYRDPVQYWANNQTFVNQDSRENITPPDEDSAVGDHGTKWPVEAPRKREKERALPKPSEFPKDYRQRNIKRYEYNTNNETPVRTKGQPGEERGNPTKYDYNMPTRRTLTAYDNPGSTKYIRNPNTKQKNQKGVSKQKSRQEYLHDKARLKPINRKRWLKKRRDPDEKRRRKYYKQYPKRYKRKGFSHFDTPAERSKDWREEQKKKKADGPAEWYTTTKWTEPPSGTETNSLRAPNLWDKSQQGLLNDRVHPSGWENTKSRIKDDTNGSGKVYPQNSDLLNNKRVLKEEETHTRVAFIVARKYLEKMGI